MTTIQERERVTRSNEGDRSVMKVGAGLNVFVPDADLFGGVEELRRTKYLPMQTIDAYLSEALKRTDVRKLETNDFFLEIPECPGVWASNPDLGVCAAELREVLFDWLVLKIEKNDRDIPVIAQINLNVL